MNTLRIFNHHVHIKFLVLGVCQFALLLMCVYGAVVVRFLGRHVPFADDGVFTLPKAAVFSAVLIIAMISMGLYRPQRENRHVPLIVRIAAGFVLAVLTLMIVFYAIPGLYLGRGVLAIAFFFAFLCLMATHLLFYVAVDQRTSPWRVLFFGAGHNAAELLAFMRRRSDFSSFQLVGCISAADEIVAVRDDLLREQKGSLLEYARSENIDEIVVTMDDRRWNFPADGLLDCRIAGINVTDTLTFYERQVGKVKAELLNPSWIIFSHGFRNTPLQAGFKRALDLVASLLLLTASLPVMLAAVIAIRWEDGRAASVLYRQERVGLHGQTFRIAKFRSMRDDAEAQGGAQWASEDDPRVTRVGRVLRKYRIDELPQLFNVLAGQMTLVGPRPERPEFVELLAERLAYYRVRECVKPGITGWAQVGYPYGASEEDAKGKLSLDLYYVKNRSMFLDLLILINTIEVVLFRKGGR